MKKELPIIILAVAAVAVLVCVFALSNTTPTDVYELTVFFTGDLHGNTEDLPKYHTIIQQERAKGANILLLDCGDLYYQGPNEAKGGIPEITMLDYMRYDAMALGNNEFKIASNSCDDCNEQLKKLAQNASFPLLCANIKYKKSGIYLEGIKPYTLINKGGLKVAVVGLCTDEINNKEVKDKQFTDGAYSLGLICEELQGKADVILALSHCETATNMRMTGASAIIAGHIHDATPQPLNADDGTPIVRAGGGNNAGLGKLVLLYKNTENGWMLDNYTYEICGTEGVKGDNKLELMRNN